MSLHTPLSLGPHFPYLSSTKVSITFHLEPMTQGAMPPSSFPCPTNSLKLCDSIAPWPVSLVLYCYKLYGCHIPYTMLLSQQGPFTTFCLFVFSLRSSFLTGAQKSLMILVVRIETTCSQHCNLYLK